MATVAQTNNSRLQRKIDQLTYYLNHAIAEINETESAKLKAQNDLKTYAFAFTTNFIKETNLNRSTEIDESKWNAQEILVSQFQIRHTVNESSARLTELIVKLASPFKYVTLDQTRSLNELAFTVVGNLEVNADIGEEQRAYLEPLSIVHLSGITNVFSIPSIQEGSVAESFWAKEVSVEKSSGVTVTRYSLGKLNDTVYANIPESGENPLTPTASTQLKATFTRYVQSDDNRAFSISVYP